MKQYGLLGYPLSHSFSQSYFLEKFQKENIQDSRYDLFPIENLELFPQLIQNNPDLIGLNVTTPYKESIIPYLDSLDETAKAVGAVNCVFIKQTSNKKEIIGFNTDVFGFKQSIKPFLETQHERALIIGTGGAAKAVHYVLNQIGIDCYFLTRNKTKDKQLSYEELNENAIHAFKLIVNATPIGMFPNTENKPPIPYQFITSAHLLYDLIYNPAETEFLKQGKTQGASILNGLSMLHQQAEEAWRIWNR